MKRLAILLLFLIATALPSINWAQKRPAKPAGSEPIPEPAIPAILAAFDKYEIVAMPEDHGLKDLDDLIFALIRNPAFPEKVNDIAIECGNSLYQPILDRYIAGEDVPFTEARKVWRNGSQPICGVSGFGFFEQIFPLVRAVNQRLPAGKRLRVPAGEPPIDWEQIKSFQDILKLGPRDASIASVVEKEVLSKHRKALMLFGTFHLFHMSEVRASAVSMYEKDYPGVTFVISELFTADAEASLPFANWPSPSLARAKGTGVGALGFDHFFPAGTRIDEKDCSVHQETPKGLRKPMADLVDAFLYLGPKDLTLREQMPAYVVLDDAYMTEVQRRESALSGGKTRTLKEFYQEFVNDAENTIYPEPKPPDPKSVQEAVQGCLDRKNNSSKPQ